MSIREREGLWRRVASSVVALIACIATPGTVYATPMLYNLLLKDSGTAHAGTLTIDDSRLTNDTFTSFESGAFSFEIDINGRVFTQADLLVDPAGATGTEGVKTHAVNSRLLSFHSNNVSSVTFGRSPDFLGFRNNNGHWAANTGGIINGQLAGFIEGVRHVITPVTIIDAGETLDHSPTEFPFLPIFAVNIDGMLINNGAMTLGNDGIYTVGRTGSPSGTGTFTQTENAELNVHGSFDQSTFNFFGGIARVNGADATMSAATIEIGGSGPAELNVSNGGALTATTLILNDGGVLSGDGMITAMVTVDNGGVFSPGNSPGTIIIDGALNVADGGILRLEVGDFIDVQGGTVVVGEGALIQLVFDLLPSAPVIIEDFFTNAATIIFEGASPHDSIQAFVAGTNPLGDLTYSLGGTEFSTAATRLTQTASGTAPEPATATVFALALAMLGVTRARRVFAQRSRSCPLAARASIRGCTAVW